MFLLQEGRAESVCSWPKNLHILINNAGVVSGKRFLECTDDELEKSITISTMAHFWTVRAFLQEMIRAGNGHIVTISSVAGIIGVSRLVDYCTSKFAKAEGSSIRINAPAKDSSEDFSLMV
jgi:all-trans-retinol dehydrogenase (NAD+)